MRLYCDKHNKVIGFFNYREKNNRLWKAKCGCFLIVKSDIKYQEMRKESFAIQDLIGYMGYSLNELNREIIDIRILITKIKQI
jgi:hypothetical protein